MGIVATLYDHADDPTSQHDYWMRLILDSIERSLADSRRSTVFFNRISPGAFSAMPLQESLQRIHGPQQMAGIIIISFDLEPDAVADAVAAMEDRQMPAVSILAGEMSRPLPHVYYDNVGAGYLAADHLIRIGYEDLTMVMPFHAGWAEQRLEGAGHDFAVVGFDDNPQSRIGGLSSVRPPMSAMGHQAARLLLHQINGERNATQIRLPAHLITRASATDEGDAPSVRKMWRTEQAHWDTLMYPARSNRQAAIPG